MNLLPTVNFGRESRRAVDGAVSATADFTQLDAARASLPDTCESPLACFNNSGCIGDESGTVAAICAASTCEVALVTTCEQDNIITGFVDSYDGRSCNSNDDCSTATDVNPCGCPVAVNTDILNARVSSGFGAEGATPLQALEYLFAEGGCDFTECAALDCGEAGTPVCNMETFQCEFAGPQ